jgi:hypothetical protein
MERISDPERAVRLARAIVSDLVVYHAERVREGIAADDLFERLAPEIAEARLFFESRVEEEAAAKTNAFDRALVDVLVYRSGRHPSRIW